jgi:hypothetical protein
MNTDLAYAVAMCDDDIIECCRCNSAAPTAAVLGRHLSNTPEAYRDKPMRICKFCYETELGSILAYPSLYTGTEKSLARAMCQAFNLMHWDGKVVPTETVDA